MSNVNEFKEGMAVIVITELNAIKKGTIKEVCSEYAIVRFDDSIEKVEFEKLGILTETEPEEVKPEESKKGFDALKEEITITKQEFVNCCSKVCAITFIKGQVGYANMFADFSAHLAVELFGESPEK